MTVPNVMPIIEPLPPVLPCLQLSCEAKFCSRDSTFGCGVGELVIAAVVGDVKGGDNTGAKLLEAAGVLT